MAIRGARMLVAGACSAAGQRLVEAFLALGAQVVAADGLRTRLEELRGRLRQHERLWVAESDLADAATADALFRDVGRDAAIDAAVLAIASAGDADASSGGDPRLRAAPAVVARCNWFVRAASECARRHGRGRVLVLLEPASGRADRAVAEAVAESIASAVAAQPGVSLCGMATDLAAADALERVVALCDPARAAALGWSPSP